LFDLTRSATDLIARGLPVSDAAKHSSSRGLVGDIVFGVLPEPKPVHCFVIVILLNVVRCGFRYTKYGLLILELHALALHDQIVD
jgi:hypothetical protein